MVGGIGIMTTNSNIRTIELKDRNGKSVGTISYSVKTKKKTKKLQYNMKQISTRVLRCKTSGSARTVLSSAKSKVAQLKRQKKSDEYDSDELDAAIAHAMQMERVAKKKMKHLQEEEKGQIGGICSADAEGEIDDKMSDDIEKELEKMSKLMEDAMKELMEEASDAAELDDLAEGILVDTDPDDLEKMKRKHRSEEMRDIIEADMKYLKAMFDKLQREKRSAMAGVSSEVAGNASLELGGSTVPMETVSQTGIFADIASTAQGASVDCRA
ncbi:MAG: hypothetical protein LUI12_10785 [Clostridiales bacterium]|nr:hypothetical protein [Clostridiales bacterium]